MKIRNYTSSVPVDRSVGLIEALLVKAGAQSISRFYDDKKLAGFVFQMAHPSGSISFKLPANPSAVFTILRKELPRAPKEKVEAQAQRTAWKLLYEWVHLQLTMIEMGQAEAAQVFLPYACDTQSGRTFFEYMKDRGFKMLSSGSAQ